MTQRSQWAPEAPSITSSPSPQPPFPRSPFAAGNVFGSSGINFSISLEFQTQYVGKKAGPCRLTLHLFPQQSWLCRNSELCLFCNFHGLRGPLTFLQGWGVGANPPPLPSIL